MKDETYAFISDVKEKKVTARSARHTRTHCGKGGRVDGRIWMATEKRLIDANALIHKMFYVEEKTGGHGWVIALEDVSKAPTVDVEEVGHGRWIYESEPYCSECNETAVLTSGHYYHCGEYCPNCGAKMDGDGNG